MTALHAIAHRIALSSVPSSVARGIVRAGSSVLSAGTVAGSNPTTAQSASAAAAAVPSSEIRGPVATFASHSGLKRTSAASGTATSGTHFSTVVTDCTQPEARTPKQLTSVNSQTTATVTSGAAPGTFAIQGTSALV